MNSDGGKSTITTTAVFGTPIPYESEELVRSEKSKDFRKRAKQLDTGQKVPE
jgi:hypothetical protein